MLSQLNNSSRSTDSASAQPDATNCPKPGFIPKPLRARKRIYDPSLTAGMRPPDTNVTADAPSVEATKERVWTEETKNLREEATKLLAAKLSRFRKLSSPNAAIMQREPEVFAKQWESDIWTRSMQSSDGKKYDDEVRSTLRLLTKCDKKWSEAWPVDDGSYWAGEEWFVWEMDRLSYDMLENESIASGPHSADTPASLSYVYTQSDSATEATEAILNADNHQEDLSPEAQLRKDNRRGFRSHIRGICELLRSANDTTNLDVVALASSWESEIWTLSLEHEDCDTSYNEDIDEALEDLDDWKTYWDSSEGDPEGSRTGRQLFLDHVQQLQAHSATSGKQTESPTGVKASAEPSDPHEDSEDACPSIETDDSDGGVDVGSDDESDDDQTETQYNPNDTSEDHGLDSNTADELWDLAGGNEELSDDSADDAGDNDISDKSSESDDSEIISPRSPQPHESDDEDESENTMDGVSSHHSSSVPASPIASAFAFTFEPSQSSVAVPIIPSGFDPGNWTGASDFTAPLGGDMAVNGSLSAGDVVASQTSEVQDLKSPEQIDEVAADNSLEPITSSSVDGDVVARIGQEHAVQEAPMVAPKELETKRPQKVVSEDCSGRIRELTAAINACEAEWLNANAGNCAPSAFVELAGNLDSIGAEITKEGDFSSPSALSKIEALFANWHAFVNTMKAYIGIKEYFHPDNDFRFNRLVNLYRSDIEMIPVYETMSRMPGAQEYWLGEANKRRESRDDNLKSINNEIAKMFGLRQAYRHELEMLNGQVDDKAFKEFGKMTLNMVHERILQVNEDLGLQDL
ncbi:uncharacterized protein J4E78_006583 [Alternaria triticimaculans]|uniref:uncharacterized protein n=1 Tax=Alternaria triticimaculans TaxID=297637 RepID=UPI0020C46FD5|nr:uncharacterized protein J4E78_006583 [Alternaria triticimaculans]KAI4656692.1 hypothetical protein J4E78_006583 [Alternaria triticimaculans]